MAPLPPNFTNRMFYDYVTPNREHTFQVRYAPAATVPEVHQAVTDFIVAIGALQFRVGWKFLRARQQLAGQAFSFPIVLPPGLAAFTGTGNPAWTETDETREYTWQGRSTTSGRRVDISLYGIVFPGVAAYRYTTGETNAPAYLAASVAALNNPPNVFHTVSGTKAVWYPYINYNNNSYWERQTRS